MQPPGDMPSNSRWFAHNMQWDVDPRVRRDQAGNRQEEAGVSTL